MVIVMLLRMVRVSGRWISVWVLVLRLFLICILFFSVWMLWWIMFMLMLCLDRLVIVLVVEKLGWKIRF